MESLFAQLSAAFGWLLYSTVQVSILVCLVLCIKAFVGGRLSAKWHYGLWLILLVRMLMPYGPQSRISVFNLMRLPAKQAVVSEVEIDTAGIQQQQVRYPRLAESVEKYVETRKAAAGMSPQRSLGWQEVKAVCFRVLPLVWFAGVIVLMVYVCAGNFNLWRIVKRKRSLTKQEILELLEDCKAELGVHTVLGVVVTDMVKTPSLFGFIRPRLLLPRGVVDSLSREELRHVFLHELAHLKRHDIGFGWLMALCQAIHWFNPLVWYAFYQMRLERELVCDALVLSHVQPDESPKYGQTIVNLLEMFTQRRRLPSLAGVLEDKSQLKRRITMITRFKENSQRWSALAGVLVILLGCVTLTDARAEQAGQVDANDILTEANLPAGSIIDANGRIVDKIDYPFENDPCAIGGWRAVDIVKYVDKFTPGVKSWKGDLFLKELFIMEGGRTNWAFFWTKGLILHSGDKTASEYYIEEIDGAKYMFLERKSGDYVFRHMKPWYLVLVKDDRLTYVEAKTEDKVDYPFVDDPNVIGTWVSVDIVDNIEKFKPGEKQWKGDLYLKQMVMQVDGRTDQSYLMQDGKTNQSSLTWTKGLVLNLGMKTASRYLLQNMEGSTYMFFEWKSGDYTILQMKPKYYVLKLESSEK